jgi:hypothetical protein
MNDSRFSSSWPVARARLSQVRRQWQAEELLLGRPEWFARKQRGWGIAPVTWQGWGYAVTWSLVIGVPFLVLLLARHRAPEAAIWLVGSLGMMVWDVRKLAGRLAAPRGWTDFEDDPPSRSASAAPVNR